MRGWKQTALALTVIAMGAATASAQSSWSIGLTGGAGMARFTTHADDDIIGYRPAWSGGIYAVVPLAVGLSLQPELLFSEKGAKDAIVFESIDRTFERIYTARYIELPLLVRYDLPFDVPLSPFVVAGPAPAYLIQAYNTVGDATPEDMGGQLESFDVGAVLGVGARYDLPFGAVRLDARSGFGLMNVDRSGAPDRPGLSSANRHIGFAVMAGFEVPIPFW